MKLLSRRYQWIAGLTSLPICLLLLLWLLSPLLINTLANHALQAYQLTLSNSSHVRLNLLRGRIDAKHIALQADGETTLSLKRGLIDIKLSALLFKHTIEFETFHIEGLHLAATVLDDQIEVAGLDLSPWLNTSDAETATETPASSPSDLQIIANALTLRDIEIALTLANTAIDLGFPAITLSDIHVSSITQSLHGDILTTINDSPFNTTINVKHSDTGLALSHALSVENLDLGLLSLLNDPLLNTVSGNVSIHISGESQIDPSFEQISTHISTGKIELNDIAAQAMPDLFTKLDKLAIQFTTQSNIKLNAVEKLSAHGGISLNLQQFHAHNSAGDTYAQVDAIQLNTLAYTLADENIQMQLSTLLVEALQLSQHREQSPLLSTARIQVENTQITQKRIDIGHITLGTGTLTATLTESGLPKELIALPPEFTATDTAANDTHDSDTETGTTPPNAAEHTSPSIHLGAITLDQRFGLVIADDRISPPFKETWFVEHLSASNIDTDKPSQRSPITLRISDGAYASIDAAINAAPLAQPPSAEVSATLKEIDLHPFSPYIETALGIVIRAGQLDQDINIDLEQGLMDGESTLALRGLKMGNNQSLKTDALASGTALSLNQALNVLKDSKGNIALTIPISGDTDAPEFSMKGFSHVIIKKAAFLAAKNYLIDAFIPYAKVVKLAAAGSSQLLKLRFEPLILVANAEQFDTTQQDYIQQLAQLLQDHETQQLQACPIANSTDNNASTIAQATRLKQQLVEQYAIDSARILLCTVKVDSQANAKNRIHFSFK